MDGLNAENAGAIFSPLGTRGKAQFPADYQGFRRYYSYYALPHLFNQHFLLHQWHARPLLKDYHRRREVNEGLFAQVLARESVDFPPFRLSPSRESCKKNVINHGGTKARRKVFIRGTNSVSLCLRGEKEALVHPFSSTQPLPDFQCWIRELQAAHGFPVDEYPGLFHWAEGVNKPTGGFRRKLRKLYLNPRQFVRDMNWPKPRPDRKP